MASLADAKRLRILRLLERQELGVAELCEVLQLPQSTVSRHLKVLLDERWLRSDHQGTVHLYRMPADELDASARRLWAVAREHVADWPAVQQDDLRLSMRLAQRNIEAAAFFAGAAGEWDKLRRELYGQGVNLAAMLALLPPDDVVVDLGCGTGQITAELAGYVRRVIGIDNSGPMLKAAQNRTAGLKNVELHQGELTLLPLADGVVDAALLVLALTYVSEPAAALREMRRIVRPGGRAIIVDLLPHDQDGFRRRLGQQHAGFALDALGRLMAEAGFGAVNIAPLPPEPSAKGPGLFLARAVAVTNERS